MNLGFIRRGFRALSLRTGFFPGMAAGKFFSAAAAL
jgi:hypothetical protein